jgi:hypothetical protein
MAVRQIAHQQVRQQAGIQAARPQHNQVGFQQRADGARESGRIVGLKVDPLDSASRSGNLRLAFHPADLLAGHRQIARPA